MEITSSTIIVVGTSTFRVVLCFSAVMLVLWQGPNRRVNQLFALSMGMFGVHGLMLIAERLVTVPAAVLPEQQVIELLYGINIVIFLSYGIGTVSLFFFATTFTEQHNRWTRYGQIAGILLAASLSIIILLGMAYSDIGIREDGSTSVKPEMGAYLGLAATGLFQLFTLIVVYRSRTRRSRAVTPAIALIFAGFLSFSFTAIFNLPPVPLNSPLIALAAYLLARAVIRVGLFDPIQQLQDELKKTEENLQRITNLRNLFLTNVSEELNGPLNFIVSYSDLLLTGKYGPLSPEQTDRLKRLNELGYKLKILADNLLDLARIETQALQLNRQPVELAPLTQTVIMELRPNSTNSGPAINVDCAGLPPVYADEERLHQILSNLISNAIQFTPQGRINITGQIDRAHDQVQLNIVDNGIGIPPEKLPLLFEPFSRTRQERDLEGSGLGLALAKKLVELHDGALWIEQTGTQGTTVSMKLPIASAATA